MYIIEFWIGLGQSKAKYHVYQKINQQYHNNKFLILDKKWNNFKFRMSNWEKTKGFII